GKLLNPMLQAVGLQREQVFIANILKCRPPDNRDPAPGEAASCLPFLERQIALIRPRLILAVGRIAAQNLLATDTPIGKLRGQAHRFGPARIPLVVTYHPAYLLRSPREKRKAWDDLRLARRALTTHPPAPGWRSPAP
ncbi:MAG: uracil-DNA glycosylase, partial [Candidatus Contendobacter sp.]|nr:uracil-DNA glycosylase [Candidatus Contendobacter sp.]